ncbi:DNA helicase Pif1-like protein [Artemisia annua]|uniref:DNA helicase Pif1-like protein n=1 Tax=Artemisia annua TaxID=35608 RepID=A0A2U1KZY7_ARTAN|nr:DNA helicase Pif1-like protein [Artemisia annua]
MEPFGGMQGSGLKTEIVQGLIHILDEQNELVQVFITARDKLNEENFPEFKIQLYNVGGAHKYQLPTSGTLGAIVIQPDPNSQTEYDIIIEYKDKQPKRINKLHSSYMSLQFPLLFVYGQPGYNTKLTLKSVNSSKKRNKLSMNMYYKYQLHERYNFKAYVADTTETVMMTFFSPKADDVVGINCETLINSLPDPSPREFPEKLLSIIGKTHIFQFHYNTSSKQTTVDFILDDILDKPETPKEIKDKPSGLPATPSPNLIEFPAPPLPQIPMQPTVATPQIPPFEEESFLQEENEPGNAKTLHVYANKIKARKQPSTQVAGDTPPTTQDELSQTSSKGNLPETSKPGTAKRQLFQEKTTDGKKNKKE